MFNPLCFFFDAAGAAGAAATAGAAAAATSHSCGIVWHRNGKCFPVAAAKMQASMLV